MGTKKAVKLSVAVVAVVLSFVLGLFVGGKSGWFTEPKNGASCPTVRPDAKERLAQRNLVWRAMNKEDLPPGPETRLGTALALIIAPDIEPEDRNFGLGAYLNKSVQYFTPGQIAAIKEIMGGDSGEARLAAMRMITGFDSQAAALIGEILSDDIRMAALVAGQPIELEKLPDGTTP